MLLVYGCGPGVEDGPRRPGELTHDSREDALLAGEYARRRWDMSDVFAAHDARNATVVVRDDTRDSATEHTAASGPCLTTLADRTTPLYSSEYNQTCIRRCSMANQELDLESDIKPVSEFRANAAETIRQVQSTGRPVVLTQRGRSSAVLLDVAAYQAMVRQLDEYEDVLRGLADAEAGRTVPHDEALAQLMAELAE